MTTTSKRRCRDAIAMLGLCTVLAACGTGEEMLPGAAVERAPVAAGGTMSEDEALRRAAELLSGTDYGQSYIDITNRIKQTQLQKSGSNDCGPITRPVWAFHLQTPYDGWLYIDASTGRKECSSLPFVR